MLSTTSTDRKGTGILSPMPPRPLAAAIPSRIPFADAEVAAVLAPPDRGVDRW